MVETHTERRIVIEARFAHGGAWAGVEDLVDMAYTELAAAGRDALFDRHAYELHMVLKRRRDAIPLLHASLTDVARGVEKTRNFPLDRAYRIVHGLVDLMLVWQPGTPWTLIVRRADAAHHLASRFFAELARRGRPHGIRVAAETSHGYVWLDDDTSVTDAWLDAATADPLPEHDAAETAAILAQHPDLLSSMARVEEHYPALLRYYADAGDTLEHARVSLRALCLYNHFGFYNESGSFTDTVLARLDDLVGNDEEARWSYLGNIFQGLVMTGRQDEAQRVIEKLAEPVLTRVDLRAKMHYLLAMVHLRYARVQDIARAETHILAARERIAAAAGTISAAEHAFLTVFIDNGLAFLRVRQKRGAEAIALCQAGYAVLTRDLGEEAHRLHRSVLQYNTAQVYAALGDVPEAIRHYDQAIAMDPNYSEYYNESANLLLQQDRYTEALLRYAQAARVSAPYPELFHNIGICHARSGDWSSARSAFDRALDLDPDQPAVLLMRAEAAEALGDADGAMADLDAAIALDADLIPARVNRAVALFDRGDYAAALAEMDRIVAIDPGQPDHLENRAEIYRAMGRDDLRSADLDRSEKLRLAA